MERKATLLALMKQAYEQEQTFVAALAEEERSQVGTYEEWSAKDLVAHNAAWIGRLAEDLLTVAQGRTPAGPEDWDGFEPENERIFEAHRAHTWEEVLAIAGDAHRALVERVDELTEDGLASCDVLPWQEERPLWRVIVGTAYFHPVAHLSGYYRGRGDSGRAGELIGGVAQSMVGLDDSPSWRGAVQYNLACHHSLLGQKDAAIEELRQALALNPELVEWSKEDPDLDPIREEPACQQIYSEIDAVRGT